MADNTATVSAPATTNTAPAKAPNTAPVNAAPTSASASVEPKANATPAISDPKADKEAQQRAAAIARAKKAEAKVLKDREAFNRERDEFTKNNATLADKAKHLDKLSELAKTDPLKYLEAAGIKIEDVLTKVAKGDTRTPDEIVETKFNKMVADYEAKQAKLAADRAELDKRAQTKSQQEANEAAIKTAKAELRDLAAKDPDKYEFVNNTTNAPDLVWDLITQYYETSFDPKTNKGVILTQAEALDTIETELENQFIARSKSSKKLQAALAKEKAEADLKAQELLKAAGGMDRYGRKLKAPPKATEGSEAKPEAKPVDEAKPEATPKAKKVPFFEQIRQMQARAKIASDN